MISATAWGSSILKVNEAQSRRERFSGGSVISTSLLAIGGLSGKGGSGSP
jgi:hypothetical protein